MLRLLKRYDAKYPKIRIGVPKDGGYVINSDLTGIEGIVSLGIGDEASFDAFFAGYGNNVYQYDPTVDGPPESNILYHFRKLGWGVENGPTSRTLDAMLEENGISHCKDLILKFDVEGAEWPCLAATESSTLEKFRIITAEFHDFTKLENDSFFKTANHVFEKLARTHVVTHIHANNWGGIGLVKGVSIPDYLEISFLRKDRSTFTVSTDPIPSALDFPNRLDQPDYVLTPFGLSDTPHMNTPSAPYWEHNS